LPLAVGTLLNYFAKYACVEASSMDQIDSNTGAPDRESVQARVLNASREQAVHAVRAPEHFAQ